MSLKNYLNIAKNELFKLNRSITGKDSYKTLKIIKREHPKLNILKFNSGKSVFDWKIPPEWNVNSAFVEDKFGEKIINIKDNNLHLVSYSSPVNTSIKKNKLLEKLHSLKNQINALPYVTSYYKKYWGFCVTEKHKDKIKKKYLKNDKFKILIDSRFNNRGSLYYGELFLKGESKKEVLISTYICHPSMANNELSGPIVAMALIKYFSGKKLKKSLRFIFVPETIGSIAYINRNLKKLKKNVIGGYNLTCIGDERNHSCMLSKFQNSPSDTSLIEAYKKLRIKYKKYSFLDRGSDERQFSSPGVDLSITSIFRSKYREYSEYHTSLDNFDLVTLQGLKGGYEVAKLSINNLMQKIIPEPRVMCEPMLSKKKLYKSVSIKNNNKLLSRKLLDFLMYADGKTDLSRISNIIKVDYSLALKIYDLLIKNKLINKEKY